MHIHGTYSKEYAVVRSPTDSAPARIQRSIHESNFWPLTIIRSICCPPFPSPNFTYSVQMATSKDRILVIEDTESMNTAPSPVIDLLLNELSTECEPVFWKSPCYEWPGDILRVLSPSRQYKPSPPLLKSQPRTFAHLRSALSTVSFQEVSERASSYVEQYRVCGSYVYVPSLHELFYREIPIGVSTVSALQRFYPECVSSQRVTLSQAYWAIISQLKALHLLDVIQASFSIDGIILSELTYLSGCIGEYCAFHGIPMFQFCELGAIPVSSLKKAATGSHCSALSLAYTARSQSQTSLSEGGSCLNSRQAKSGSMLNINESNRSLTNELALKIAQDTEAAYLDVGKLPSSKTIILYLHAVSDGAYAFGYDGFYTPYDFFEAVCECIASLETCINVVIKMHPNSFGLSDHFLATTRKMAVDEYHNTSRLATRLVHKIRSLGMVPIFTNPNASAIEICKRNSNTVHVTQFGSIALELLGDAESVVLFSSIAPYARNPIGGIIWQEFTKKDKDLQRQALWPQIPRSKHEFLACKSELIKYLQAVGCEYPDSTKLTWMLLYLQESLQLSAGELHQKLFHSSCIESIRLIESNENAYSLARAMAKSIQEQLPT